MRYEIPVTFAMEDISPTVGSVINEVNDTMKGFGFSEKLTLQGPLATISITTPKLLDAGDKVKIREQLQQVLDERLEIPVRVAHYNNWNVVHCHAGRDGECHWDDCPQIKDGEPEKSGRHCPLDGDYEEY